jgi:response regulator of citrate/malate metabolism
MAAELRVLLVEDELIIAMEYELMLQEEGHEVVGVAAHAETALVMAREHKPDLALVDIMLRDGATGPQIAEYLCKALHVPVLFISSNSDQLPDHLHGAVGALAKPVAKHRFIETIRYLAASIAKGELNDPCPSGLRLPEAEPLS